MWTAINRATSLLFDALLWPLSPLPALGQLAALGALAAVLALLVFRHASDQVAIARSRGRVTAHLLELWIFRDDLRTSLRAQRDLLLENLHYLRLALLPALLMIPPFFVMLAQIEGRFAFRGLAPGEAALITAELRDGSGVDATLRLPERGVRAETPPLRIGATRQVVWRVRASEPGTHRAELRLGPDQSAVSLTLLVGEGAGATPSRRRASDPATLLVPTAATLPRTGPLDAVHVGYPRARSVLLGLSSAGWSWLGFALLAGLLLRRPLGVAL